MEKATEEPNHWDIRQAKETDIPFIYDTWKNCYKHGSSLGKSCRSSLFFNEYRKIIDSILSRSKVLVACKPNEQDVIFGYMVTEKNILHFIFIKEDFREFGIGKSLYNKTKDTPIIEVTHKTFHVERLIDSLNLQFNPFLLYRKELNEY